MGLKARHDGFKPGLILYSGQDGSLREIEIEADVNLWSDWKERFEVS